MLIDRLAARGDGVEEDLDVGEVCGPDGLEPLEELAGEFAGKLTVAKVDIDDNPVSPNNFSVRGIPTLILFKDGKPAATQVGAMPKSRLKDWIQSNL